MVQTKRNINFHKYFFNSLSFKIIALISMIIDHIGVILFPENKSLRIIGRIALPIFTFLIAFGFTKTKNPLNYFGKLFFMFICIQVPTTFFLYYQDNPTISPFYMNIFLNLSLGVGFILIYKKNKLLSLIYFILIFSTLYFIEYNNLLIETTKAGLQKIKVDYGLYGFLLIVGFWFARELQRFICSGSKKKIIINLLSAIWLIIITLINQYFFKDTDGLGSIQFWALIDILLLILFTEYKVKIKNQKQAKIIQYLFYFSYPLTLLITISISLI